MPHNIVELYIWMADDKDQVEGLVVGVATTAKGEVQVPLFTPHVEQLPLLKERAKRVQDQNGKPMRLKHFVLAEIVDELPVS